MKRHSLFFRIIRGALVGFAGGLALGLALIFVMASEASAQTSGCQAHENLARLLEERFAEHPVAAGLEASGLLIELFASADSASWTLVTTTPAGESCVIAVGEHWLGVKPPAVEGPHV
jgi:hypothetical protein